jgi:hydrogenase expression/formation protein HypD
MMAGLRFIREFRDPKLAQSLARQIAAEVDPNRTYRFMEFCGGHTHAIARYGIPALLPPNLRMIHGPGCPVCVLPPGRVAQAIAIAEQPNVTLCAYGDVLRVPTRKGASLLAAKAQGADVRMVGSALEAVALAEANPQREVVFFAIGFETTTPPTAAAILAAQAKGLRNFSVLCCHVLTPSAIMSILESSEARRWGSAQLDGFVGPAHVSVVIGSRPYEFFAEEYQKPVVIAGFEPLDVLHALLLLVRQVNEGRAAVENQYTRAVTRDGNRKAQALVAQVFELRKTFAWRGLGVLPYSALRIRAGFSEFDAEARFAIPAPAILDHPACECGAILRGHKSPRDCKLFAKACTPETPLGSCMVSSEGACAAYYHYGRFQERSDAVEAEEV